MYTFYKVGFEREKKLFKFKLTLINKETVYCETQFLTIYQYQKFSIVLEANTKLTEFGRKNKIAVILIIYLAFKTHNINSHLRGQSRQELDLLFCFKYKKLFCFKKKNSFTNPILIGQPLYKLFIE